MKEFSHIIRSSLLIKSTYNHKVTPKGMTMRTFNMRISLKRDKGGSQGI